MGSQRFRAAFEHLVEKWCDYRAALADLREFEAMEPDMMAAIAGECGLSVTELRDVVVHGSGASSLMARMMQAYGCLAKGRCRRELDAGTAADHADGFCPNAYTFERLIEAKR
jgi:hypothetical protein